MLMRSLGVPTSVRTLPGRLRQQMRPCQRISRRHRHPAKGGCRHPKQRQGEETRVVGIETGGRAIAEDIIEVANVTTRLLIREQKRCGMMDAAAIPLETKAGGER